MSTIVELKQSRAKAIADARAIVVKCEGANRDLNAEENAQYDAFMADAKSLNARAKREEESAALSASLQESEGRALDASTGDSAQPDAEQQRAIEAAYFRAVTMGDETGYRALVGQRDGLTAGTDTAGGYLVTPQQIVERLLKNLDNEVFVRNKATKFSIPTSASLGCPSLVTDPSDPTWTSEILTGTLDSSMALGKRELHPRPLAKSVKISKTLLRMVPGMQKLVEERLAYVYASAEENVFMNGTGVDQPLGVFTASADGIPTSRDYSTGNTTTALTFAGLIGAKYKLKAGHRAKASWMFHTDAVAMLAKITDSDGQFLWRESVRAGEPDRLLGLPIAESEYVPNTFTTGLYVGILGNFEHYWIADALSMDMQFIKELYAATNQAGIFCRKELDGMPVLAEAFTRVKLA